jgi:hypothetical protein
MTAAATTMVGQEDRPDLTVNTEAAAGSAPRELGAILGSAAVKTSETKQVVEKMILKETGKDTVKDNKDTKDSKEQKDHKEPKDTKDNKDTKDHKDPKDTKDQKDQKDPKEHKDQKDTKDHKDPKEHKDLKDVKEHKELGKEIKEASKEAAEVLPQSSVPPDELTQLINRVSGLEKAVAELKK